MADIASELAGKTGISVEAAQKGLGVVLGLLKSKLPADSYAKVTAAVPGADSMIAAAPDSGGVVGAVKGAVGKIFGADDVEIAGLQGIRQMDEYADLKGASLEGARFGPAFADETLPSVGSEADIDNLCQFIAACMTMFAHDRQCVQEAAVLRRRLDVHQIEQPKEQASVPGVDRPKQRQFVVAMQGRYRLALLCQRVDSALFRQELPDLAAECGIGFLVLGRLKYFPKDADQGFLDATLLGVEGFQLLLGQGLCSADTAQHHFDQLIASAHPCLAQQGKYQRMTFARLRDVEKIIHLQGGGLRGELAELGMGDTLQKRIRIEHTGHRPANQAD